MNLNLTSSPRVGLLMTMTKMVMKLLMPTVPTTLTILMMRIMLKDLAMSLILLLILLLISWIATRMIRISSRTLTPKPEWRHRVPVASGVDRFLPSLLLW
jgi:hypothetical protein